MELVVACAILGFGSPSYCRSKGLAMCSGIKGVMGKDIEEYGKHT